MSDSEIIYEATQYLIEMIHYLNPQRVFVAADGVPPMAKIAQQRIRRFMARFDETSSSSSNATKSRGNPSWNRNKITPGTTFMAELNKETRRALNDAVRVPWEYSGSDVKGEGEQKIVKEYRKSESASAQGGGTPVIYGLDADLIIFSMVLHDQNCPPPLLCRERGGSGTDADADADAALILVDTRELIEKTFAVHKSIKNYVVCSFLCGNDFCLPLTFLNIRDDWHRRLWRYCETNSLSLVCEGKHRPTINWVDMKKLLEHVYAMEDAEMKKADTQFWKAQPPSAARRDVSLCDFYPLLHKDPLDQRIDPGRPGWRNRYYARLHGTTCPVDIENIAANYALGLQWNLEYYYTGKHVDWHNPHNYSPTAADLYLLVNNNQGVAEALSHMRQRDISEDTLLAMVMPVFDADLVPSSMSSLMRDPRRGCAHMYPSSCKITTYLKSRTWECRPTLPPLRIPTDKIEP
jgi:5'-3' exonuclease